MPVTYAIIGATLAVHLAGLASPDVREVLLRLGAQQTTSIAAGEWYRVFTAALLHADAGIPLLTHVGCNMFWLWIIGGQLESRFGSAAFGALYLASAAAGGAAAHLVGHGGIGASDAIYGLLGAAAVDSICSGGRAAVRERLPGWLLLFGFGLSMQWWSPDGESIGWAAHIGGLLAGLVIAGLWQVSRSPTERHATPVVPVAIGCLALLPVLASSLPGVAPPLLEVPAATAEDDWDTVPADSPAWSAAARTHHLTDRLGAEVVTDLPAADAITVDPHTLGVYFDGIDPVMAVDGLEIVSSQTDDIRRALQAAVHRWYLVDHTGKEWPDIDALHAAVDVAPFEELPWTTPYVSDLETTEVGVRVWLDLEGEPTSPEMQAEYLRVLVDELRQASVRAAHVRPWVIS